MNPDITPLPLEPADSSGAVDPNVTSSLDNWFDDLIKSSQTLSTPPAAGTARIVTRQALAKLIADTERRSHALEAALRLESSIALAEQRRASETREAALLERITVLELRLADADQLANERQASIEHLIQRQDEAQRQLALAAADQRLPQRPLEWFGLAAMCDPTEELSAAAELASRLQEPATGVVNRLRQRLLATDQELTGRFAHLDPDETDPAHVLRTVELVTTLTLTRMHLADLRRLA
jgi:hypothetical protein